MLLCTDKNDHVVRYALATSNQPIAISSYDILDAKEQAALPSGEDKDRALTEDLTCTRCQRDVSQPSGLATPLARWVFLFGRHTSTNSNRGAVPIPDIPTQHGFTNQITPPDCKCAY